MNTSSKQLIKTVHALDTLSLHHEIEFQPVEARAFALSADAHPQDTNELRAMLKEIDAVMPRMSFGTCNGLPNPNNGKTFHTYKIGKAYSRLVIVQAPKLYAESADWDKIEKQLHRIGHKFGADEVDTTENTSKYLEVRLWWD